MDTLTVPATDYTSDERKTSGMTVQNRASSSGSKWLGADWETYKSDKIRLYISFDRLQYTEVEQVSYRPLGGQIVACIIMSTRRMEYAMGQVRYTAPHTSNTPLP